MSQLWSPRGLRCAVLLLIALAGPAAQADAYFPPPGNRWERRSAIETGFDAQRLADAVQFALAHEVAWERDIAKQIEKNVAGEPYPAILGEANERGGPAGMVVRHGYIVSEWGDTERVEMSFSVAKSYLATMAGLALDAGLIADVDDQVREYVRDGDFATGNNRKITWRMLLNQTSEWKGSLWDKPDIADRRRGRDRELQEPGTFWEYNDVRVNRLALALLQVWRRPLPAVLKEKVMDPIGASATWVWKGYRNSWVEIDGERMWSVSGGSHWGGGFWASTRDHARFGYLMLRRGTWAGRRIISERWIDAAIQPTPVAPHYGFLWWLMSERASPFPSAPAGSYFALGSGGNSIWIWPRADLVVVTRWVDFAAMNTFIERLRNALVDAP